MIPGLLYCLAAVALVGALGRRSLGLGLVGLMAVGYAYGIVRANLLDGASHFAFDLALVTLYAVTFVRRSDPDRRAQARRATTWMKALFTVPVVLFFVPLQHPLVQLVGLRAAILFLPLVVLGARLTGAELERLGVWLMVLNVIAVSVGALEYFVGVDRFFPRNEVTRIIYASTDVGLGRAFRIPATFSSAHAFGGVMVATLPFLAVGAASATGARRVLVAASTFATVLGVFMCGARYPVVQLALFGTLALVTWRLSVRSRLAAVAIAMLVLGLVGTSERLQRFTTLADEGAVEDRVRFSANVGLVDTVLDHPLGVGLGRASGTSIPFFLQDVAAPQIGLENEYARIALEQGLLGLAIFFVFILDVLTRRTSGNPIAPGPVAPLFRYLVATLWGTAFIGTGALTSIPGTALMLLMMGVLLAEPPRPALSVAPGERRPLPRGWAA